MNRPELTTLLRAAADGDGVAGAAVYERAYAELKRIAIGTLRRHGDRLTLNPSTLVHEAYLKLAGDDARQLNDSQHFYSLLARAMRQVVLDLARAQATVKHGDGLRRTELTERTPDAGSRIDELLGIDQALTQLQALDSELADLVELHFFAGLSFVDIAALRGVNERTVRRHWDMARAFLLDRLPGN
jgi:RNA polymerase sigma factor (TIGR02999 family)